MRGAQGSGDARGERAPVRANSRVRSHGVYARRRILAAIILLVLLALVVPRACGALLGSEDSGPAADQGQKAPGNAAGVAGDTDDGTQKANTEANATGEEASETKENADAQEPRESGVEQADGAEEDLGELLIENVAVVLSEPAEPGGDEASGSGGESLELVVLSATDVGDGWQAERLASIARRAPLSKPVPARRRSSEGRSAGATRTGATAPDAARPAESLAPQPAVGTNHAPAFTAVAPVPIPKPVVHRAPGLVPNLNSVPMVEPAPVSVPARRDVAPPVRRAPLPVVGGVPGRRVGASIAANVPAGFGRGVASARPNNGGAFPRAGAVRGALRR